MKLKTVNIFIFLVFMIIFRPLAAESYFSEGAAEIPKYLSNNSKDVLDENVRILKRVLQYQLETRAPEDPVCINLYWKLAKIYEEAGDLSQALIVYEKIIDILDTRLGRDDPKVKALIPHVIDLYQKLGRIPSTENNLKNSKEYLDQDIPLIKFILHHQSESLGKDHPKVLPLRLHLAKLYYEDQQWVKAEKLYRTLLDTYEKKFQSNVTTAPLMLRYGEILWRQEKTERAFQVSRDAVDIFRSALGPTHPKVAEALRQLLLIAIDSDRLEDAKTYAKELFGVEDSVIKSVLAITSEKDRFNYLSKHNPYAVPAVLEDVRRLTLVILRYKGIILDSLIEDIRRAEAAQKPRLQSLIQKRKLLKERLVQYYFHQTEEMFFRNENMNQRRLDKLRQELDTIEREIAHYVSGLDNVRQGLHLQIEDIQGRMPKNAVLIEFVQYPLYKGFGKWTDYYSAIIIRPEQDPQWIQIGEAGGIDKDIQAYHRVISTQTSGDRQLSNILQVLYQRVWKPIERNLSSSEKTVILSPDGMINFISFATLLTENEHFLGEKYLLHYITSGRDLLNSPHASNNKNMLIFSNPHYSLNEGDANIFTPLPGTIIESKKLKKLAKKNKLSVTTFSGDEANEMNMRNIKSPHILHIAAHGFFDGKENTKLWLRQYPVTMMKDSRQILMKDNGYIDNPMHKSGIVLSPPAFKNGNEEIFDTPNDSDGILTADEISMLDLYGTWLVVVPACYTGLGSLESVEGVVGLRRGFVMAGGQNVLTALWRVNDTTTTPDFMEDFYRSVFTTQDPVLSLAKTQQEWLAKLRVKKGIAAAVREIGSFVLISKNSYR